MKIIYLTFPDSAESRDILREAVDQDMVKCVNIFPMTSMYKWDNTIQNDSEITAIVKCADHKISDFKQYIQTRHSYEVPCFLTLDVDEKNSSTNFLNWINS